MSFPADIKGCMKDCILSLLWARGDIHTFFADHGCTRNDLKAIENFKARGLSRSAMVDTMFQDLSENPEGGLG